MGTQLVNLYKEAQVKGGLKARIRLAMLTGISSTKAMSAPDSPANIAKFRKAIREMAK